MSYPIVAVLILSLVVRYWPGEAVPAWIRQWLDRVWLMLALTFALGISLALYNVTKSELPHGGYQLQALTPKEIQYVLMALCIPLTVLTILGMIQGARSSIAAWSQIAGKTTLIQFQSGRMAMSVLVALAAIGAHWAFGGPFTFSSEEGYSSIVPLVVDIVATMAFFAALGSAWNATKVSAPRTG
jgi:hypothetical protein